MNPARFNDVLYEEAISQLNERFQLAVFEEGKCPMDKGKADGTKAQQKAGQAAEPKEKKPAAPKAPTPPAPPKPGGGPAGGGGKMCGNPRQAKYLPPNMSKLGAEVNNNSEFDDCPEGQYFCTKAGKCRPIPSGQGIGEDGMRVERDYKECARKDGTTYGIPDSSDCTKGTEVRKGKPAPFKLVPRKKTENEMKDEGQARKNADVMKRLAMTVSGKAAGILGVLAKATPVADASLAGQGYDKEGNKLEGRGPKKMKGKDSPMRVLQEVSEGLQRMTLQNDPKRLAEFEAALKKQKKGKK